jgi:hypothetical protein
MKAGFLVMCPLRIGFVIVINNTQPPKPITKSTFVVIHCRSKFLFSGSPKLQVIITLHEHTPWSSRLRNQP